MWRSLQKLPSKSEWKKCRLHITIITLICVLINKLLLIQCEVQYMASNLTGDYAVALQVEDFMSPTDITPLSSIPIQFIVHVQAFFSNPPCTSQPELVGTTPLDGSCIGVPFNTSWSATLTARVSHRFSATSIAEFVTASPLGMRKSV